MKQQSVQRIQLDGQNTLSQRSILTTYGINRNGKAQNETFPGKAKV